MSDTSTRERERASKGRQPFDRNLRLRGRIAEHHFSNYCVCPSPLVMAAACARITRRIRLATGVLVLPLYHPARLIAEIGMVDAVSGGRLSVGVGSGYRFTRRPPTSC